MTPQLVYWHEPSHQQHPCRNWEQPPPPRSYRLRDGGHVPQSNVRKPTRTGFPLYPNRLFGWRCSPVQTAREREKPCLTPSPQSRFATCRPWRKPKSELTPFGNRTPVARAHSIAPRFTQFQQSHIAIRSDCVQKSIPPQMPPTEKSVRTCDEKQGDHSASSLSFYRSGGLPEPAVASDHRSARKSFSKRIKQNNVSQPCRKLFDSRNETDRRTAKGNWPVDA